MTLKVIVHSVCTVLKTCTIRYDTIGEFNVDSKTEYSALSSTRSQKKKLKQTRKLCYSKDDRAMRAI